ncbi:uracil-DNA glycosylase [Terrabacter aerolatus]|uniref:Uracil-DNA glycosylase n=1 Tax=Terrabacter aerolatus TaxID=422442 RepID=A0A512CW60_9MICO|nr:uracil-DNA glycosylase family protein [Terrabacter aerolatus]GEO28425.1 uracil-DNA glycosylase [Terrabacter aerolatus]
MAVVHQSCAGYAAEPFASLVAAYPGDDVYPSADFRTEWGPIFHRGRLDGSARLLVLGQDPATHEAISRRILVGEAGQRVQGLLAKVGVDTAYVMVNVYLYSVFGQSAGNRHVKDDAIAAYRNRWLDALLVGTGVTAVLTLGDLAATAYGLWVRTLPAGAPSPHLVAVRHPTYPEGSARATGKPLSETTAALLADWNEHLPDLAAHVAPEGPTDLTPYAATWGPTDLAPIPEGDLPAGAPAWWRGVDAWAVRDGADAQTKRATIDVVVPEGARTWPAL